MPSYVFALPLLVVTLQPAEPVGPCVGSGSTRSTETPNDTYFFKSNSSAKSSKYFSISLRLGKIGQSSGIGWPS